MLAINISACIAPPPSSPAASRSRYLRFAASRFRHIHRSPATPLIILLTAAQTLSPGCAKVTTPLATSADFDSLPILQHAILWTSSHYGADLCVFYLIPHLIDVPALATMHARRGVTSQSTAPFPATSCPGTDITASDTSGGIPGRLYCPKLCSPHRTHSPRCALIRPCARLVTIRSQPRTLCHRRSGWMGRID
jgi:hypothetical protein